jgi:pimeloyl-ACP methyl ester carboxylesterase
MSVRMPAQAALEPAAYSERFVEIAGLRLRIQDYGTAGKPALLCLHGGAANAHWYDFVAGDLRDDYHVLAVDLRGHGDSAWHEVPEPDYTYRRQAADVHELTEKLDLRDFVLIAHSMGGMIGCVYCATYPGRARAFVVVDSNLVMTPERIAAYREVGNREGREYASEEEFVAAYRVRPDGSRAAPEVLRHIARASGRQFPDGRWRHKVDRKVYANRELVDSFALWDRIRIPALLMQAQNSVRMRAEAIAQVRLRAPQASVAVVPDSGHHITLDNPGGFVRATREFLAPVLPHEGSVTAA